MKKHLYRVAVFSLLVGAMPMVFTGCKDYDDDITTINTTTSGLTQQIASLQSAIDANKAAAAAASQAAADAMKTAQDAASKGDKAAAAAAAANALAEEAKAAAAQAKADALAKIADEAKALQNKIDNNSVEINKLVGQLAELQGKIDAIEPGLKQQEVQTLIDDAIAKLKIPADYATAIEELTGRMTAVETQIEALKGYESRISALETNYASLLTTVEGLQSDIATAKTNIATIQSDLATVKGDLAKAQVDINAVRATVEKNTGDINSIKNEIGTINSGLAGVKSDIAAINTKIQNIEGDIVTKIQGVLDVINRLNGRLTSVTLIPDLYIGGIPSIEFKSAKYTSMTKRGNTYVRNANIANNTYTITNNEATAKYRLSPATISEEDIVIPQLSFVHNIANSRAEAENEVVAVKSASIANNELVVKAGKGKNFQSASLMLGANKFYTVSLKVPVASKHLFDGENEAYVYSEYSRIDEFTFTPELAAVPGSIIPGTSDHFYDYATIFGSARDKLISVTVPYDKTLNLNKVVEGCENTGTHRFMTLDELRTYGLTIKYNVAAGEYKTTSDDQTDQQKFVKLSGYNNNVLTPVTSSGQEANLALVGKTPIIEALLVDSINNQIVDARYLKVAYTEYEVSPEDVVVNIQKPFEFTLDCSLDHKFNVTWKQFSEQVLEILNNNAGMSKEKFVSIYGVNVPTITCPAGQVTVPPVTLDNLGTSVPVMTWTIDKDDLTGSNAISLGGSKTFTATVKFTASPAGMYSDIVVKLTLIVTAPNTLKPAIGTVDGIKWQNNTMLIYPIPYGTAGVITAEYDTNILQGRNKPYVNGLNNCTEYQIVFGAYYASNAAQLLSDGADGTWYDKTTSPNSVNLTITNNADGIKLVENCTKFIVNWNWRMTGVTHNPDNFHQCYLQIVKILNINTVNPIGFKDASVAQTINIMDSFSLTDAYGYTVAQSTDPCGVGLDGNPLNATQQDLWDYYVISSVEFDPTRAGVKLCDSANDNATGRDLASLNMTANVNVTTGELTFQNAGAPLQSDAFLRVPVKVTHKWGVLTANIYVPLKKAL